jgi:hypothetical protein
MWHQTETKRGARGQTAIQFCDAHISPVPIAQGLQQNGDGDTSDDNLRATKRPLLLSADDDEAHRGQKQQQQEAPAQENKRLNAVRASTPFPTQSR